MCQVISCGSLVSTFFGTILHSLSLHTCRRIHKCTCAQKRTHAATVLYPLAVQSNSCRPLMWTVLVSATAFTALNNYLIFAECSWAVRGAVLAGVVSVAFILGPPVDSARKLRAQEARCKTQENTPMVQVPGQRPVHKKHAGAGTCVRLVR